MRVPVRIGRVSFSSRSAVRADKANGGFGEEERQQVGQGKPKDSVRLLLRFNWLEVRTDKV